MTVAFVNSPRRLTTMHTCLLLAALAVVAMPGGDSAEAADIGRLAAALDSEDFTERERAEERLVAEGLKTVEQVLGQSPLPEGATDAQADRHCEQLAAQVETELARALYRHLDPLAGLEPRYRAQRACAAPSSAKRRRGCGWPKPALASDCRPPSPNR